MTKYGEFWHNHAHLAENIGLGVVLLGVIIAQNAGYAQGYHKLLNEIEKAECEITDGDGTVRTYAFKY